jgi:hypothetical protein
MERSAANTTSYLTINGFRPSVGFDGVVKRVAIWVVEMNCRDLTTIHTANSTPKIVLATADGKASVLQTSGLRQCAFLAVKGGEKKPALSHCIKLSSLVATIQCPQQAYMLRVGVGAPRHTHLRKSSCPAIIAIMATFLYRCRNPAGRCKGGLPVILPKTLTKMAPTIADVFSLHRGASGQSENRRDGANEKQRRANIVASNDR